MIGQGHCFVSVCFSVVSCEAAMFSSVGVTVAISTFGGVCFDE